MIGKLASVTGTVRQVAGDGSWFTIADGYMNGGNEVQTKVYVGGIQCPASIATIGNSIKVIGPVAKEYAGGTINSVILLYNFDNSPGAGDEMTFFTTSDLHYTTSYASPTCNETLVDMMNALPTTAYPAGVGGNVQTPRGVIVEGDIADGGTSAQFDMFALDFGINSECRLRYPVREGLGNHDGATDGTVALRIKGRTPLKKALTAISPNGMHYSWDWAMSTSCTSTCARRTSMRSPSLEIRTTRFSS